MIPALIGLFLGGLIVVAFWDEITNWLKELIPKIKAALSRIAHAAKVFGRRVKGSAVHIIHKLFYREQGKLFEEVTKREIDESELPDWAADMIGTQETDITHPMEEELQMTLS